MTFFLFHHSPLRFVAPSLRQEPSWGCASLVYKRDVPYIAQLPCLGELITMPWTLCGSHIDQYSSWPSTVSEHPRINVFYASCIGVRDANDSFWESEWPNVPLKFFRRNCGFVEFVSVLISSNDYVEEADSQMLRIWLHHPLSPYFLLPANARRWCRRCAKSMQ